jgi:mono/diheme cytochrome c family protein
MSEKPLAFLRWLSIVAVALATIAGIWAALPAVANAAGTDAAAGQQIFQEKCIACHTVGKGALVGPDLKGVTARRPREWLEQWIAAPDAMLAKKDPVAISLLHEFHDVQMPNPGLGTADITAVLAYLETAQAGTTEPAASAPAVQGNPEIGKDQFTGVVRFQNGGPPCMACHSAGGIGALGGGQLGPDLSAVASRYGGAAGLDAFVAGTPTPTMKAVWSKNPLTTEERANVVSFLGQAGVSERPAQAIWQLAGLAGLGAVLLLAVAGFRWRNRSTFGVWRPMVARPTTGPGAFHRTIANESSQHTGSYRGGWFKGPFHDGWRPQFKGNNYEGPRPSIPPRRRS